MKAAWVVLAVVGVFLMSGNQSIQDPDHPLVPFYTNFWSYWDHHWMTWLPEHPVYEAIEVSTYDNPRDPDYKLIRVFLTEREGDKRQYFYLNNEEAVERSRANAFYREIKYRTEGAFGEPLNLYLEFRDKDDQLVEWSIEFEPGQQLRKNTGGLTPSIHSVGYILLFMLRDKTADTPDGRFVMGGVDYSFKGDPETTTESYRSWYNHNYYSAVIVFGHQRHDYENGAITNTWGRSFRTSNEDPNTYVSNPLGHGNRIRIETNDRGEIQTYRHVSLGHSLRFDFDPALPTISSATSGQRIRYSVSFDDFRELMLGEVSVSERGDTLALRWQPSHPDWALDRPFESLILPDSSGYDLSVGEVD